MRKSNLKNYLELNIYKLLTDYSKKLVLKWLSHLFFFKYKKVKKN